MESVTLQADAVVILATGTKLAIKPVPVVRILHAATMGHVWLKMASAFVRLDGCTQIALIRVHAKIAIIALVPIPEKSMVQGAINNANAMDMASVVPLGPVNVISDTGGHSVKIHALGELAQLLAPVMASVHKWMELVAAIVVGVAIPAVLHVPHS